MNQYVEKSESGSKKFWRIVFGTMVGIFISSMLVSILSLFMMIGMIASISAGDKTTMVKENSILKIDLPYPISERTIENPFEELGFENFSNTGIGLNDILASIKYAAGDEKIKGIYLNVSQVAANPASIEEIRNALSEFKKSGKFVYAYSEVYSQSAYYLASVADKVFINKKGDMEFKGIALQVMFFKGLLDKLDIEMQVIRHGQFKSAVEPYILDKMSEANREQMEVLCKSMWQNMIDNIAKSRNIPIDSLNYYADNLLPTNPDDAVNKNLVDYAVYYHAFEDSLRSLISVKPEDKINYISLVNYKKSVKINKPKTEDKIAVIYAVGEIIDGKGDDETIGSETLCKEIKKAYEDDDVKAIVLRVNSPGGSALASEIIWNEIEMAKKAGKIVVTSMGDYAASGGYYISCNSDAIVAQPNTLTGSIGVFGIIPNVQQFLKNKLGITVDVAKSNAHSDYYTGVRKLDDIEYKKIQIMIEDIYATFTQRVADGRKMEISKVDEIGQGRVWTGANALEIGLVDKIGNMDDAITLAAKMAKLDTYQIKYYPEETDWLTKFLNKNSDDAMAQIKAEMGKLYESYDALRKVSEMSGIQARMPMTFTIE